jgi:hypothetical protein
MRCADCGCREESSKNPRDPAAPKSQEVIMIKDRDIKDVLRVLETFDQQTPRAYMSKQQLGKLFNQRFDESTLKHMVRHVQEKRYIECIEYGDFIDYRIRIASLGRDLLRGSDKAAAIKQPLHKKLLWIIVGIIIYGIIHYLVVRLTH